MAAVPFVLVATFLTRNLHLGFASATDFRYFCIMMHRFKEDISHIALPELFTWPFHYAPHPLCRMAAAEVQQYISTRDDWHEELQHGKMFGVLVVTDEAGETGFLAAFSGNLAGTNRHEYFVPPVYDMLHPDDFFRRGEAEISALNRQIAAAERSEAIMAAKAATEQARNREREEIEAAKAAMREAKAQRDARRSAGENPATMILESQRERADLQRLKRRLREAAEQAEAQYNNLAEGIDAMRRERASRSAALQMELFSHFHMLNARGETKDLCELFAPTAQHIPPAGAGECAAPKLLQYAYLNGLRPVAMAEFWWGDSPTGEVRRHGEFYPACIGKCKPILTHMLEGLDVEPNPLLGIRPPEPRVVWEDDTVAVIDKPSGMLSVEGKSGVRSVAEWARERYPDATGPVIVHRLDQSTSGLMVLARDKDTHAALQAQFIHRTVKKFYTALLDGRPKSSEGRISLPLKLDYENRPRQMVADDGKSAVTLYKVIGYEGNRTRILFQPLTGRTHQLRVHSASALGLDCPIAGDDIYGHGGGRLCLHASRLEFDHPTLHRRMTFESKPEF